MATKETYTCRVSALHEDEVQRARAYSLPANEVTELAQLFKVLGDPTRTRILRAVTNVEIIPSPLSL